MKIATYHKMRGDYVEFYKGLAPFQTIAKMDRVYVTSTFTFFFDTTVETILHYTRYIDKNSIFIGGIAVTLLADEFKAKTGVENVISGQLHDSSKLGYDDLINIDMLPLDYDILDDIEYEYNIDDNFFAYTTRGCKRGCAFCAVNTLEPCYFETNNIVEQVSYVRNNFGDKRNLMLMDNNTLFSEELEKICTEIISLGFVKDDANYIQENPAEIFFSKIDRRISRNNSTWIVTDKFILFFKKFISRVKKESLQQSLTNIIDEIDDSEYPLGVLLKHKEIITEVVEKYRAKKPLQRYVDFNQGIDARLVTNENMRILSQLPLKPLRLAYDNTTMTSAYINAFRIAYDFGIRHFSNYMLYNYDDSPDDFWQRVNTNVLLYNEFDDVSAFSFPMKYAPVDKTNRAYIGVYWNKKYLSALNVILNVTKGVIAKEHDFFERAYGRTPGEFQEILSMPNEFIKYRDLFDEIGFIDLWKSEYRKLSVKEQVLLIRSLSGEDVEFDNAHILSFYKITKHQVETQKVSVLSYQLKSENEREAAKSITIKPVASLA